MLERSCYCLRFAKTLSAFCVRYELSAHRLQSLLLELRVGESIRVGLADAPIAVITLLKKTGTKARLQIRAPGAIAIHKHSEPQVI